MVLPDAAEALNRGNAALATAMIARELDATAAADVGRRVELMTQAAIAARAAGDASQAERWARSAVTLSAGSAAQTQALAIGIAVFCGVARSRAEGAAQAVTLSTLLPEIADATTETFARYAELFAWTVTGHTEQARQALARLQALPGARALWIAARMQVCEAVIDYLEADPESVSSVLDLLQPFTVSAAGALPVASMWWEIAELRFRLGHQDEAWEAATRAIDASGVRAADGRSSFAPGVLTWDLSI